MKPTIKIPRKSPLPDAPGRSHKRRDAVALSRIAQVACAYPKCGQLFTPRRKDQVYHSPGCRKADWFELHFISRSGFVSTNPETLPRTEFAVGDTVRDLNGLIRTVTEVVWSVAYFLDGEQEILYQPDEISHLREKEKS